MKKLALIAITSIALSGCSWTRNTFFGEDQQAQYPDGSGYPYYYSSAAAPSTAGAIDANEGRVNALAAYPPAAPGAMPSGQPNQFGQAAYNPAPMSMQPQQQPPQAAGGYGIQSNAPSVRLDYGTKGTDVGASKVGEAAPSPQPKLPASTTVTSRSKTEALMQGQQAQPAPQYQQPQYQPQQYGAPQYQPAVPPVIAPAPQYAQPPQYTQPAYPAPVQPQAAQGAYGYAQPQPVQAAPQGMTYEQYQQMYYGQQQGGQYQYPPTK